MDTILIKKNIYISKEGSRKPKVVEQGTGCVDLP